MRQSAQEFLYESHDRSSSARNPAGTLSQQSLQKLLRTKKTQLTNMLWRVKKKKFSHVFPPPHHPPPRFSHVLVYFRRKKGLSEEVFWPLRVPEVCLCEGSGCRLVRSCPSKRCRRMPAGLPVQLKAAHEVIHRTCKHHFFPLE